MNAMYAWWEKLNSVTRAHAMLACDFLSEGFTGAAMDQAAKRDVREGQATLLAGAIVQPTPWLYLGAWAQLDALAECYGTELRLEDCEQENLEIYDMHENALKFAVWASCPEQGDTWDIIGVGMTPDDAIEEARSTLNSYEAAP